MAKRSTRICPLVYAMEGSITIAFPRWLIGVSSAVMVTTVGNAMPIETPTKNLSGRSCSMLCDRPEAIEAGMKIIL
jgi:hypothetical protein